MKVEIAKNKKFKGISILIITLLILVPSAISLFNKLKNQLQNQSSSKFTFEKTNIEFENIYSQNLETLIQNFIQDQINQKNLLSFDQQALFLDLKNKFPIIKSFNCNITAHTLNIKIIGTKPFCLINKEMVLGNKKQLFPTTFFEKFDINALNNISINNALLKNPLSKSLYSLIRNIPNKLFENYEINFIKSTEIYLTPKNHVLKYFFVSNQKTIFDEEKLEKAQELYQMLMHDTKFTKKMRLKKDQMILIDLRFKNRIITRLENSIREGRV